MTYADPTFTRGIEDALRDLGQLKSMLRPQRSRSDTGVPGSQRVRAPNTPGAQWTYPIRYGRIISLSSCSTMWQCQTKRPARS
jgi:hypothetical protein